MNTENTQTYSSNVNQREITMLTAMHKTPIRVVKNTTTKQTFCVVDLKNPPR